MQLPGSERVAVDQEQHRCNQQIHEYFGNEIHELPSKLAPCKQLDEGEQDYATVKHGNGQKIEDCKVYAEKAQETKRIPHVFANLGVKTLCNHDRSPKSLSCRLRLLRRHKSLEHTRNAHCIPLQLLERIARRHPCRRFDLIRCGKSIDEVCAARLVTFRNNGKRRLRCVSPFAALDHELRRLAAGNLNLRLHLGPCTHGYAADRNNLVAGLHSSFVSRSLLRNLTDNRRDFTKLHTRNDSQKHRKRDSKHDISERTGNGHNDGVERSCLLPNRHILFALGTLRLRSTFRINIWNRHIAAERYRAYPPFDAIDELLPEHRTEANGKRINPQPTPSGGKEVAEFMNENCERKKQHASRYRQNSV